MSKFRWLAGGIVGGVHNTADFNEVIGNDRVEWGKIFDSEGPWEAVGFKSKNFISPLNIDVICHYLKEYQHVDGTVYFYDSGWFSVSFVPFDVERQDEIYQARNEDDAFDFFKAATTFSLGMVVSLFIVVMLVRR